MLIFGHRFLESEKFYHITNIDAITHTPPSSIIFLEFSEDNLDIIKHLNSNCVKFALYVNNISEIIYASSLNAKYIITNIDLAKTAQNLAETYMFDSKILVKIEKEEDIEEIAILGIDGVVFSNAIVKISS